MDSRAPESGARAGALTSLGPVWAGRGRGAAGMRHAAARPHPRHARSKAAVGSPGPGAQQATPTGGRTAEPRPTAGRGSAGRRGPHPRGSVLGGQGGAPGHLGAERDGAAPAGASSCVGSRRPTLSLFRAWPDPGRAGGVAGGTTHLPACHRCTPARHPPGTSQGTVWCRKGRSPTHTPR